MSNSLIGQQANLKSAYNTTQAAAGLPPPPDIQSATVLSALSMTLDAHVVELNSQCYRLEIFVERVFGPEPKTAEGNTAPKPNGQAYELSQHLDHMKALMDRLRMAITNVERIA